ncbi:MAG: PilZ domain-containing protein [Phycisphaerales bacterium]|nr:PilZ domain-containing protein [Phycisphaerales bacterium]
MATANDTRFSPRQGSGLSSVKRERKLPIGLPMEAMEAARVSLATRSPFRVMPGGVAEFKDRRRRRRVAVQPMYTKLSLRVLSKAGGPLEGHVLDISETGMSVQIDDQVPVGQPVTVEFAIAGLGRLRQEEWPTIAAAAEVVRIDDLADFPQGPYRTALRFVRMSTMAQAQIARFVATQ